MIAYYKLLDVLNRRGMTRLDLQKAIGAGPSTIAKISKNEPVTLTTIDKICETLQCQPGDIIEWIPTKGTTENDIITTEND